MSFYGGRGTLVIFYAREGNEKKEREKAKWKHNLECGKYVKRPI